PMLSDPSHPRESAVTPPTCRTPVGVDEASRKAVLRLAVALVGLVLFVASFVTFRLIESPPEGTVALLLEIGGWIGMLAAARILTDPWLPPSLLLSPRLLP